MPDDRNILFSGKVEPPGTQQSARERVTKAPPSRAGKRLVAAFVDPEVLKQFRLLVLENDSTIQETLVKLINEYFKRHGKPPLAR